MQALVIDQPQRAQMPYPVTVNSALHLILKHKSMVITNMG